MTAMLIGVATWRVREVAIPESSNDVPASRANAGARAATTAVATNNEPLPVGTAGETWPDLVQLADKGNGAAALRLANLVALCASYVPRTREAFDDALVDGLAKFEPPGNDDEARELDALVTLVVDVQDRQATACPGYAQLGIVDAKAEQLRWTQIAARHGEAAALVAMANAMVRTHRDKGDIVQHAEQLRALRPQAIALLQQAADTGEPAALLRMAAAHRTGDLANVDPVEAYAWMLAYRAGPPAPEFPQAAYDLVAGRIAAPLDDAQRAQAQRRAEAIRARCCGDG